jgi:hypothetical protein
VVVDCALGAAPCLSLSDTAGFAVDEAEVVLWSPCRECRVRTAEETAQVLQHDNRGGTPA